jgi:hypothetical protein
MVFVTWHAYLASRGPGTHGGCPPPTDAPTRSGTRRPSIARAGVVVRERRAAAPWGEWDRACRPCPYTYPRCERDQSRGPSLLPRYSSRRSSVLRPPRTPAAHDSISPSAYTSRVAVTPAAQTGLSCSVPLRARVLRPLPRRDHPHVLPRTGARMTWPSPRHDRLGSRVVNVSRLQASLDVAARVLASSVEACDTPLGPRDSHHVPGVCYSALRGLPRRDLHPLEMDSGRPAASGWPLHDAP